MPASESLEKLKLEWEHYAEEHSVEIEDSVDSVSRSISQILDDWNFLDVFILINVNSEKLYLMLKAVGVSEEIARVIEACDYKNKFFSWSFQELLGLIRTKTDELLESEEIGSALERFSNVQKTALLICPSGSDWRDYMERIRRNLLLIEDAVEGYLKKQVFVLYDELGRIQGCFHDAECDSYGIHDFVDYLVNASAKIAHQSFDFWINRNDTEIAEVKATKLVDLLHQIHPTNAQFINFFLSFLVKEPACVNSFSIYLLASRDEGYLQMELMSFIDIYISNTLQRHSFGEDVSCLFEEINVVLRKVAILHRHVHQEIETDHWKPCSVLHTKVLMLKMELFIKQQLGTGISSTSSIDDQILEVDEFVKNLRVFVEDLCEQSNKEYGRRYLMLAQELNDEVQSLQRSLQSKEITNFLVKHSLFQLLYKIVFFKSETVLSDLLKKSPRDDTVIASVNDQIKFLLQELTDFKQVVTSQLMWNSPEEETIFMQIESVARKITLLSYSVLPSNDKEIFLSFSQLLDKAKHIRAEIRKISPPFSLSNFPKTCRVGFIDFLCKNIRELLKYGPVSIAPVKHRLEEVPPYLKSLKSFLMKVSDPELEKAQLNDLGGRIGDTTHKLEYVVESILVDSHSRYSFWLRNLLEGMRVIKQQLLTIPEISYDVKFENPPKVSGEFISKDTTSAINEVMVDLVEDEAIIINQLMRGSSQGDVVSIVGMPGIGKTTLARKVYNNQNITHHFPRRAWCTVSQVYSKRELLLDILSDIHGVTDEIHQMTDEDLQSKLRRGLLGNRYLIILDDVWDIAAWNELKISFPEDQNGSRILITSRLRDVHSKINPDSDPHLIRLFSDEESWELLEKKIFKGLSCPGELLLTGKKIAQHCQGLPLAVVAIAGLLERTEQTQDWWGKISKSLSSVVINDPDPETENRCMEILELSYKHLPEHLKPCFLYLGVFLEDKDIPLSKLTKLWMAEGFVLETETKSLEDVAQDYLMELINRSLVIVSKKGSNGKVKACRLHDLLRDLCHAKAKGENFFRLVTMSDEPYASFSTLEYDLECHNESRLDPIEFENYRLSIYLRRDHFIDSKPSGPRTRSLIFFAYADKESKCPYDISFICNNFKLLRVLDVESINMGVTFPFEIGLMVHLRYLAVSGYVRSIPPSIAKLWKLQTLIVKGFRGKIILPNTIWSMASLRHLHVNEHVSFNLQDDNDQDESSFRLDNLVSFSSPSLSCVDYANKILRRLPNLLKMGCIFLKSWDSSKSCNRFPVLEFLTRLESLKIIFYGGAINAGEYLLPLSLKKLTLSNFRLSWSHISKIGRLPNLVVLKLLSGEFEGTNWEMNEEEFEKLEFLKLDDVNIAEWSASYDHLPNLKRLILRNCIDLQEVPLDFAYINTLEMVEVQWCGKSLEDSAETIGKETKEIKVVITSS